MSERAESTVECTPDQQRQLEIELLRNAGRLILDQRAADKHRAAVEAQGTWFKVRYALRSFF